MAMKVLCVHAHFDDFELTAGGIFTLWRQQFGDELRAKVVICTDGEAGHHERPREETGRLRLREQEASAEIGQYEMEQLRYPSGEVPREACLQASPLFLAALWKTIRDFEPDYLFCPPLPTDPLAGIHVDHVAVADAVRKVAYMVNVPHAFTPEYPVDETSSRSCKVPVVLNVYDSYMAGENACDLVVDIEEVFDTVCRMAYCHQTQIMEWLPWVGRHRMAKPASLEEWRESLRQRFLREQAMLGLKTERIIEAFTVTAWGSVPTEEALLRDFPNVLSAESDLARLRDRLKRWGG